MRFLKNEDTIRHVKYSPICLPPFPPLIDPEKQLLSSLSHYLSPSDEADIIPGVRTHWRTKLSPHPHGAYTPEEESEYNKQASEY